jgi:hypothetical protein
VRMSWRLGRVQAWASRAHRESSGEGTTCVWSLGRTSVRPLQRALPGPCSVTFAGHPHVSIAHQCVLH